MDDLNKVPEKILESITLGEMDDLRYFQQKLTRAIEKNDSHESIDKIRKQLSPVIYHDMSYGETSSES